MDWQKLAAVPEKEFEEGLANLVAARATANIIAARASKPSKGSLAMR